MGGCNVVAILRRAGMVCLEYSNCGVTSAEHSVHLVDVNRLIAGRVLWCAWLAKWHKM